MIPIRDTAPCHSTPFVTWGIIAVCCLVFITMYFIPDADSFYLINRFGMVPMRYAHGWASYNGYTFDGYFSFISNLFLHATWWHLLTNAWFLWIFADAIEDRMGHWPFLAYYLICGASATVLQWFFDPSLTIPVVGASGAIAGVLAAYFFLYPLERVILWVPIFLLPVVVHVPAITFLGLWILLQLHNATTSIIFENVQVDVAWWAHLGGFIAGTLLYRFFLRDLVIQQK